MGARVWLHALEHRISDIGPDVVHCHNVLQISPPKVKATRGATPSGITSMERLIPHALHSLAETVDKYALYSLHKSMGTSSWELVESSYSWTLLTKQFVATFQPVSHIKEALA
jgi:hypothetical protein